MTINEYRKAYPKRWESYDSWFTPELGQIWDKSEFLDKVVAKINEEPDNFEFQRTLYDHYMLVKEYRKALKTINDLIIKFPELAEDLENTRDNELYVSGDIVEARSDFREFFNSQKELIAARMEIFDIIHNPQGSHEDKVSRIKTLIEANPVNLLYLVGLRDCYIRTSELDKAKEAALNMVAKAREIGLREVIIKGYESRYLKSIDKGDKNCL